MRLIFLFTALTASIAFAAPVAEPCVHPTRLHNREVLEALEPREPHGRTTTTKAASTKTTTTSLKTTPATTLTTATPTTTAGATKITPTPVTTLTVDVIVSGTTETVTATLTELPPALGGGRPGYWLAKAVKSPA